MFPSKVRHDELRQNNIASHSVRKNEEFLDIFMDKTLIFIESCLHFFRKYVITSLTAQSFVQKRVIGAHARVSTRSKFQTLMVKSHVLDVTAGRHIHVVSEVQSIETNHHVLERKLKKHNNIIIKKKRSNLRTIQLLFNTALIMSHDSEARKVPHVNLRFTERKFLSAQLLYHA